MKQLNNLSIKYLYIRSTGSPRACRARYISRSRPSMGSQNVLQFPRPDEPVPDNGVPAGRRHDDAAHEEGHAERGVRAVLRR